MTSIEYEDVELEKFLDIDGSLRDIYVTDTTIGDWEKLIEAFKNSHYKLTYLIDMEIAMLPKTVASFFDDADTAHMLKIQEENIIFNTFFMRENIIELDLDPRDFVSLEQNSILYRFMRFIADTLDKTVKLTPENTEEECLMEIKPNDEKLYIPSLGPT